MSRFVFLLLLVCAADAVAASDIRRLWLSFERAEPTHITVNWETEEMGDSEVLFGISAALGGRIGKEEKVTLHHVEIPLPDKDAVYHYQVKCVLVAWLQRCIPSRACQPRSCVSQWWGTGVLRSRI